MPGDVAIIHPIALASEVDSLLVSLDWPNTADEPSSITHTMKGAFLLVPSHFLLTGVHRSIFTQTYPQVTMLRTLFTRHLDFNAVPRRSFFDLHSVVCH